MSTKLINLYVSTMQAYEWCLHNEIEVPINIQIALRAVQMRHEFGSAKSGFYGHAGRDATNQRGGSLPRQAGANAPANVPENFYDRDGWVEIERGKEIKGSENNMGVFRVDKNAQQILDSGFGAKFLVGLKGKHKGEVLFNQSSPMSHSNLLSLAYPDENVDNWSHWYVQNLTDNNQVAMSGGTRVLQISLPYAGVAFERPAIPTMEEQTKALNNIFKDMKRLHHLGVPKDTVVFIKMPGVSSNSFRTTIGDFELSLNLLSLYELGGRGSGFRGHAGRDAENLRGGSVARDGGFVVSGNSKIAKLIQGHVDRLPIQLFDGLKDVSVTKIYTESGMGSTYIGTYSPDTQEIRIDPKTNPHPERTFYHELGHHTQWRTNQSKNGKALNKKWKELCKSRYKNARFISPVDSMCESHSETFAEMFRIFYFDSNGDRAKFHNFLAEKEDAFFPPSSYRKMDNLDLEKPFFEMLQSVGVQ